MHLIVAESVVSHTAPFLTLDRQSASRMVNITASPGYYRLNSYTNPDYFSAHWEWLWRLVCSLMCRQQTTNTPHKALRHISTDGFGAQQPNEDVSQFFSRLDLAYSSAVGNFITTATVNYPPSGVKKIAIWSDSTTAISQWPQLTLPSGATEHLSAKARRFFSWADKLDPLLNQH